MKLKDDIISAKHGFIVQTMFILFYVLERESLLTVYKRQNDFHQVQIQNVNLTPLDVHPSLRRFCQMPQAVLAERRL